MKSYFTLIAHYFDVVLRMALWKLHYVEIFISIKWSWSSLIESQLPIFIVFYLHVLNNHLSRTLQIKLGIVLWVQRCSTYCKLSNSVGTNIMHKHYTSQSAYGYDLEVQLIDNSIQLLDQYQYLGNCPPTPPLTQH